MAKVPVIDSPCPFRADRMPEPGRDHCGHCDRQVHNLDGMSGERRQAFLAGCSGKVCVAYTVHRAAPRRNLALGAGLMALAGSSAVMAQAAPVVPTESAAPQSALPAQEAPVSILTAEEVNYVLVGGILDAKQARWVDESLTPDGPALPEIDALEWLPSKPTP